MRNLWDALYNNHRYIYLGEWHSHPDASACYSALDRNTMIEISEADSVRIKYPIFMIVGYSKNLQKLSSILLKIK